MLFITNRQFNEGFESVVGRKVTFDLKNNAPNNSVYFCERKGQEEYTEIGSKNFLYTLASSPCREILLYLHGFSNLPEPDIFPRASILQEFFNLKEKNLIQVVPVIWPCDNDIGVIKDYWDDQQSADMSAFSFMRTLAKFLDWRKQQSTEVCLKRINILAHSMGNRVLEGTLSVWNKYQLTHGVPQLFRNTFMVAADLLNESLNKGHPGELISHASRNVSIYFASDDWALRSSKITNLRNGIASRRLGHTGPEDMDQIPHNVYALDCDDFNNVYDPPFGHSYFLATKPHGNEPGLVFDHMYATIKTGRVFPHSIRQRNGVLGRESLL